MNSDPHNPLPSDSVPEAGEETLRLIASLPAPVGLEDRVHKALRAAPRRGRVLAWPKALHTQSGWIRSAAAAAIVFVVAGGGWGVYTRVHQNQPPKVIVMPRMPDSGGFSGAGAVRTPQTVPGPALTQPAKTHHAQAKGAKKPAAAAKPTGAGSGQPEAAARPAVQPSPAK
jgi:hypothetical protein